MRDLNICLLGMSGSGKTASLKSIVAKEDINPRGGWNSVVEDCQHGKVISQGRLITVVDSPSLFSTHMTSEEKQMDQFRNSVAETSRHIGGFDALVLVLSYGRRFGEEDKKTVHILKTVLGNDWLKTHGMVLMTGGDNFERDFEDDGHQNFKDFCHGIRGPMSGILKECNYRCVLFDNVSRDERNLERQREMLVSGAGTIADSQGRFIITTNWQSQSPEPMPKSNIVEFCWSCFKSAVRFMWNVFKRE